MLKEERREGTGLVLGQTQMCILGHLLTGNTFITIFPSSTVPLPALSAVCLLSQLNYGSSPTAAGGWPQSLTTVSDVSCVISVAFP